MTGVIGVYHGTFGRVALFRTNQPVHEHAHPHVHALLKVEGNDGVYDVSGSPCPITDHKMVLVNPWVPHANWRDVGDAPITILALYLEAGWLAARRIGSRRTPAVQASVGDRGAARPSPSSRKSQPASRREITRPMRGWRSTFSNWRSMS